MDYECTLMDSRRMVIIAEVPMGLFCITIVHKLVVSCFMHGDTSFEATIEETKRITFVR